MTRRRGYKRYSAEFKREALKRASEDGTTDKIVCEELHYLGSKVSGFSDKDGANHNAPEFARSVLQIPGEFIRDA